MNPEQLDRIGQLLHSAPPLEPIVTAYRAYVLVGLLQLALRHPLMDTDRPSAQIGREMANGFIAQLSRIDPLIAQSLDQGWTPEFDLTDAEAAEYFDDPEPEETIASVYFRAIGSTTPILQQLIGTHALAILVGAEFLSDASQESVLEDWLALIMAEAHRRYADISNEELKQKLNLVLAAST